MASKTINIEEKVYKKLKKLKGEKSFTQIIDQLIEENKKVPWDLFGSISEDELNYDEIKRARKERNVSF